MLQRTGFSAVERSLIRGEWIDASTLDSLTNWYPVIITKQTNEVVWRDMGQARFTASFFQNSLDAQDTTQRRVCTTNVAALGKIQNYVKPSAFIFHVSRCGSTLLTQMLSSLERCIVLSEPPVVDIFFRNYCVDVDVNEEQLQIFRQLIAALGQKRFDQEAHLIIKLDSWHISRLDFIRRAFPHVPMYFLYRQPQEVLASHQKQRGPQMIPHFIDMGNLTIDQTDLQVSDLDGYCLRVLDQYFQTAVHQAKSHRLQLINYTQLPQFVWESLLHDLNIQSTENEMQNLRQRATFHSKHPQQNFSEKIVEQVPHACLSFTRSLYEQLESMRITQTA
jgi:transcription termination factor NusB